MKTKDKYLKREISIQEYQEAIKNALTENDIRILSAMSKFPNISYRELSRKLKYRNDRAAQLQIGRIGKRIANYLNITPNNYEIQKGVEKPAYFAIIALYYFTEGKSSNSNHGYEMRVNLQKALEKLKNNYSLK